MAVLWWAWVGYAWLTNCVHTGAVPVRAAIFTAMGAMIVVALAVPEAFDRYGVLFAFAVGVVRAMFLVLFHISTRDDPAMRTAVDRMAIGLVAGPGLLVAAGLLDGAAQAAAAALCVAVLPLALAGPGLAALAALVGICAGLAAYELARFGPARRRVPAGAG